MQQQKQLINNNNTNTNTNTKLLNNNEIEMQSVPIVNSRFVSQRGKSFNISGGLPKTSVYNVSIDLPSDWWNYSDNSVTSSSLTKTTTTTTHSSSLKNDNHQTPIYAMLYCIGAEGNFKPCSDAWTPQIFTPHISDINHTATLYKVRFIRSSYTAGHCSFCVVLVNWHTNKALCRTETFKVLARKPPSSSSSSSPSITHNTSHNTLSQQRRQEQKIVKPSNIIRDKRKPEKITKQNKKTKEQKEEEFKYSSPTTTPETTTTTTIEPIRPKTEITKTTSNSNKNVNNNNNNSNNNNSNNNNNNKLPPVATVKGMNEDDALLPSINQVLATLRNHHHYYHPNDQHIPSVFQPKPSPFIDRNASKPLNTTTSYISSLNNNNNNNNNNNKFENDSKKLFQPKKWKREISKPKTITTKSKTTMQKDNKNCFIPFPLKENNKNKNTSNNNNNNKIKKKYKQKRRRPESNLVAANALIQLHSTNRLTESSHA